MFQYFFILGRNPALSAAEIISLCHRNNLNLSVIDISNEALLGKFAAEISLPKMQKELGGCIKIGQAIFTLDLDRSQDQLLDIFSSANLFKYFFSKKAGKVHFGFSLYFLSYSKEFDNYYSKILKNLSLRIKDELKKDGQSSGFIKIKERFLSSVSVAKNELLKKGAEIVLLVSDKKLIIGRTLTVQEFGDYSFRDFGRPARDKRSGIIPPKLGKIMINLSEIKKEETLLDPFCGSGTILTEAVLLGHRNIIGSDLSSKAIADTSQNLNWIQNKYPNLPSIHKKLFTSDIKTISTHIPSRTVSSIITEPYLGPPFTRFPHDWEIKKIQDELVNLYLLSFREFAKILKKNARVIFIFPVFRKGNNFIFLDIFPRLDKLGFHLKEILPPDIKAKYTQFMTGHNTYLYGRGDEIIFREVAIFDYV